MCIWDSYVYLKGVLCFLIHKSYVRSIKKGIVLFVSTYAAITEELEIFILQYNIIIITGIMVYLLAINVSLKGRHYYYYYYYYYYW